MSAQECNIRVLSGYNEVYLIPRWLYYGVSAFEVILSVALFTRYYLYASALAVVLFMVGVYIAAYFRGNVSCGCFGEYFVANWRLHMVIASACGCLACLSLVQVLLVSED